MTKIIFIYFTKYKIIMMNNSRNISFKKSVSSNAFTIWIEIFKNYDTNSR